ncbi:MAG: hypothetical protein ACRDRI_26995 [Pseudonocardiaceae bacterium]
MKAPSTSLRLATAYLHRRVQLRIDRPACSRHPEHAVDLTDNDIHRLVAFQELPGHYAIVRDTIT